MELVNEIYRLKDGLYSDPTGAATVRFAAATAASLLFPFAPHLCSEVYEWLEEAGLGAALAGGRSGAARARDVHAHRAGERGCAIGSRYPRDTPRRT